MFRGFVLLLSAAFALSAQTKMAVINSQQAVLETAEINAYDSSDGKNQPANRSKVDFRLDCVASNSHGRSQCQQGRLLMKLQPAFGSGPIGG